MREIQKEVHEGCHLYENPGKEPWSWYVRREGHRIFGKIRKFFTRITGKHEERNQAPDGTPLSTPPHTTIGVGDLVRIRSLEEIRLTLNSNGTCNGWAFVKPMEDFCGREFRVAKRVEKFFDERQWRMLRAKNVVLLQGVYCDGPGHPDTQECHRMCFFYWRTEWLVKIG